MPSSKKLKALTKIHKDRSKVIGEEDIGDAEWLIEEKQRNATKIWARVLKASGVKILNKEYQNDLFMVVKEIGDDQVTVTALTPKKATVATWDEETGTQRTQGDCKSAVEMLKLIAKASAYLEKSVAGRDPAVKAGIDRDAKIAAKVFKESVVPAIKAGDGAKLRKVALAFVKKVIAPTMAKVDGSSISGLEVVELNYGYHTAGSFAVNFSLSKGKDIYPVVKALQAALQPLVPSNMELNILPGKDVVIKFNVVE